MTYNVSSGTLNIKHYSMVCVSMHVSHLSSDYASDLRQLCLFHLCVIQRSVIMHFRSWLRESGTSYHWVCSPLHQFQSFVILWNLHCSLVHFQL